MNKSQLQRLTTGHVPFPIIHFFTSMLVQQAVYFGGWALFGAPSSEWLGVGSLMALAYLLMVLAVATHRWNISFLRRRTGTKAPSPEVLLKALHEEHHEKSRAAAGVDAAATGKQG
jgi:hypothetical protein